MKNQLRKFAKEKRCQLPCIELSLKIQENLKSCDFYKLSRNVMAYYSIENEVCTMNLLNDTSKNWYLPKIKGDNLLVCPYEKSKLLQNKFKISEPTTENISSDILDLIIIPALSADSNGYRIGYGKGYYDRFLKNIGSSVIKVVLIYSDLFIDNIYPDKYDVKCDYVVTDREIYKV